MCSVDRKRRSSETSCELTLLGAALRHPGLLHTSRGSARIMVSVVMSSDTRVPEISLALSTLARQPTTYRGPLLALTMTGWSKKMGQISKDPSVPQFEWHFGP